MQIVPKPLPDRRAILGAESEGISAAGNFTGKNSLHPFKLHFDADYCDHIALIEDEFVVLDELSRRQMHFDSLVRGQSQNQMRTEMG